MPHAARYETPHAPIAAESDSFAAIASSRGNRRGSSVSRRAELSCQASMGITRTYALLCMFLRRTRARYARNPPDPQCSKLCIIFHISMWGQLAPFRHEQPFPRGARGIAPDSRGRPQASADRLTQLAGEPFRGG